MFLYLWEQNLASMTMNMGQINLMFSLRNGKNTQQHNANVKVIPGGKALMRTLENNPLKLILSIMLKYNRKECHCNALIMLSEQAGAAPVKDNSVSAKNFI